MNSPHFALTSAFSKTRCNFLPSYFANITPFFSSPFFSSPVAYLVSLTAWLLYIDKVFFSFLSPVPHCDWVSDSGAWNQVPLVVATSLSVEVKQAP